MSDVDVSGARSAPSFDSDLLEVDGDSVRLIAAECTACSGRSFPLTPQCPRCGGRVERILLAEQGELYASTTLSVPLTIHPAPTTIAQVDFGGVTISGWLQGSVPEPGAPIAIRALVIESGPESVTGYCFRAVDQGLETSDA